MPQYPKTSPKTSHNGNLVREDQEGEGDQEEGPADSDEGSDESAISSNHGGRYAPRNSRRPLGQEIDSHAVNFIRGGFQDASYPQGDSERGRGGENDAPCM